MTFAFNLDEIFIEALNRKPSAIKYAVFDDPLKPETEARVTADKGVIVASGSKLGEGDLENFLGEVLSGFNRNAYIHDKFLLVDPLGDDPVVVTGSANFSRPSQTTNDENMLVVRGDLRVADIYFGEFMRIFDHHYSRYVIALLKAQNRLDPEAGYLKATTAGWLPSHFSPGRKDLRRRQYMA